VISGDPERISEFMTIRNPRTKEAITLPSTGMLLSKKSWESFGFTDSGELTLYDSDMNPYAAEAVSSFDKFFMVTCVMSTEAWQNIHKEKMTNNTVWVRGTADADVLKEKLSDIPGFQNLTVTKDQAASLTGIASILGVVTVILIIAAGLMAYFVQMNLVTMYVNQKKRELTIMRVNGFTTKEVIRYALGESLVTTFFGIVLGIAIGSALTLVILNLIEHDFTTFNHNFDYLGWLYSALITIVYSLAVNLLALRIVKNLKLRDVA